MSPAYRCRDCGAELPDQAVPVCAACLLAIAAAPGESDAPTVTHVDSAPAETDGRTPRLMAGLRIGAYRIERLLGTGGMGEVYEAEQLDHGRRVALKVLNQRLQTPADRVRFLREGQLAASITHPHTVYIFGSESIDGLALISMELLAGGTLKDRVDVGGPMAPADAVDAVRQVIAGLAAAHEAGILHRDVKPANCFVDLDGTVKIGDFGLSISTGPRDPEIAMASAAIMGTPQFAAPEQMKGEPLDVRADIYAVGATLFYLLTARAPFEAGNLGALLARVLNDPPPSARAREPRVPAGLDTVIGRCLAKDPGGRPATYGSLDEALRPFSTEAPIPASVPLRFAAGAIDHLALLPVISAVAFGAFRPSVAGRAWAFAAALLYFSVLEGFWGASLGKRCCGVRLARSGGWHAPGITRAGARAVLYLAAWHASAVAVWLWARSGSGHAAAEGLALLLSYALVVVLFVPTRRQNGFASLCDWLTATRVVQRPPRDFPRGTAMELPMAHAATGAFGPFSVLGELGPVDGGRLLVAYDAALKRRVWIHQLDPGVPPVSSSRRRLARLGRLRWLTGIRTTTSGWDAYEAPDGAPLRHVAATGQPWHAVKHWMAALAAEVEAGLNTGTLPPLSLDRVWVTSRGSVKLLDFTLGSQEAPGDGAASVEVQPFLARVAITALTGKPDGAPASLDRPLPGPARDVLLRLHRAGFTTIDAVRAALAPLLVLPDRVSRRRRAASCVLPGLVLLVTALIVSAILTVFRTMTADIPEVLHWLDERHALEQFPAIAREPRREALDLYLAGVHGSELGSGALWASQAGRTRAALRPLAQQILDAHPQVPAADLARAMDVLQPEIEPYRQRRRSFPPIRAGDVVAVLAAQFLGMALLAAASGFATRGGIVLRFFGVAVVTMAGGRVARSRALWRTAVAWAPLSVTSIVVLGTTLDPRVDVAITAAGIAIWIAGAVYAITVSERGLQDRIAGTWLVPG